MKWFWYSLIVFCLLMCSCRSKKIDSNVRIRSDVHSDLSYLNKTVKIDSSKTAYFANEIQNIVIEEDITVIEYDKESGKPIKETNAKRKTTQDTNKVVAEEENQSVTDCNGLEVDHIRNTTKKVDAEVKEESIGGQDTFAKWFGITTSCIIGLLVLYLLKKYRVN